MTDKISKEITLENRLKFFEAEVRDYFEHNYKNENGNEDTREVCLIHGGYRIALQAEEYINRQKAKIEELRSDKIIAERHEKDARELFVGCTRQLEEAKAEIERLKKGVTFTFTIEDFESIKETIISNFDNEIKSEAIKEFAERLTDKISVYSKYVDVDGIVILNRIFRMIEDIVKEMTKGE